MNTNQNVKGRRLAKPAAMTAGAVLVASMTAAPAYAWHLHSTVSNNIKHAELLPASAQAANESGAQNILLIGGNTLATKGDGAGMFVVMHVSADRKRIDLVQFPREMTVNGAKDLQAAYDQQGGTRRAAAALQSTAGVHVDHVAKVSFDSVKNMINTIGGLELDGQKMSGEQVLDWVGSEDVDADGTGSDVNQGERQLTVLKAVVNQGISSGVLTNPAKLSTFLDAGTKNMTVDQGWKTSEIEALAASLKDVKTVNTLTAPVDDRTQLRDLGDALEGDSMADYAG